MKTLLAGVLMSAGLATGASAVTITISDFTTGALGGAVGGLSNLVTEDFEGVGATTGIAEVTPGAGLSTAVGTFSSLGGTGTGGTVTNLAGNTGTNLAVRSGNVFGRQDIVGGQYYLDSNDTHGIGWDVSSSAGLFNTVIFAITDASEFSFLRIIADGVAAQQRNGNRLSDGNTSLVEITFDTLVSSARIELAGFAGNTSTRVRNDGFSIDGVSVGIASVPLPASLPLLVAGFGGLALLRRRAKG